MLRIMACFAAFVALLFFAISARADENEPVVESEEGEISEPSWIPSIDVGFETFDYNVDSTVQNFTNDPTAWVGTEHEAERQLMFRIGGELMGPAFEDLPGRPRLFVQGGVQLRTFSSDQIFGIGNPKGLKQPAVTMQPEVDIRIYNRLGNFKGKNLPTDFLGQGSTIFGRFQDPSWYAAVGVSFSVPIARNLLLQIKPSLEYSLEKIDFDGRFTTVNELNPHEDPPDGAATRDFFIDRSSGSQTTTDHSIGAGLELALVLFRNVRPIRVSLYTEARFMWLLGDTTTTWGDQVASYSVMRDDFGIKGGGGIRLSWVGYD
ncbi:MAG: hypothetical protein IH885_00070 [Myxococcales bacterium]|nr:hypothetical protein [Myxococcales bacterium]